VDFDTRSVGAHHRLFYNVRTNPGVQTDTDARRPSVSFDIWAPTVAAGVKCRLFHRPPVLERDGVEKQIIVTYPDYRVRAMITLPRIKKSLLDPIHDLILCHRAVVGIIGLSNPTVWID
jgi:hypothetical protein